jgi:hypothetical protein
MKVIGYGLMPTGSCFRPIPMGPCIPVHLQVPACQANLELLFTMAEVRRVGRANRRHGHTCHTASDNARSANERPFSPDRPTASQSDCLAFSSVYIVPCDGMERRIDCPSSQSTHIPIVTDVVIGSGAGRTISDQDRFTDRQVAPAQ